MEENQAPKPSSPNSGWKYASIILGIIVFLFVIARKAPAIPIWMLFLLAVIVGGYYAFKAYKLQKRYPSTDEMVKSIIRNEAKRGIKLDETEVTSSLLGKDLIVVRFTLQDKTYLYYNGAIIGPDHLSIPDLRIYHDRSSVLRILAEKGILSQEET